MPNKMEIGLTSETEVRYRNLIDLMIISHNMRRTYRQIHKFSESMDRIVQETSHLANFPMSPDSTLLIERENDAEHTGMMAIQIAICDSIIPLEVNRSKLYRMAAVHDLPEVLAGDTWYLDPEKKYRNEIECVKAREIFAKHPDLMELWIEAKEHKTLEGIYCKSFDILQAVTAVYINKGYTWRLNKVTYEKETGFSAWIWQDESNPIGALLRILFHDALEQELFYKGK